MIIDEEQIPRQWYCPITQEIMKDPVIASDGFSYQKLAIEKWFSQSDISPLTGIKLNKTLIPNHALRHTITQFIQNNPVPKLNPLPGHKACPLHLPELGLAVSSAQYQNDIYVKCSIQPPESTGLHSDGEAVEMMRNNCSIICILDVSESMDTDSVLGGKEVESYGFSRLDLVKHSINTMVEFMGDNDEIGLVAFSTSASIALPMTRTTKAGKNIVKQTTKNLSTIGTTNIWDGFKVSIDLLRQLDQQNRSSTHNIFVLLLTDGQPNLNPPRGIVPTLIKFLDLEKIPVPNIHVFGYGYELDSYLLSQIAEVGYGTYTYIPDCSMVGTSFVNFMANALATITNDALVTVEVGGGRKKGVEVVGVKGTAGNDYHVGAIQFGQTRQFLVKIPVQIFEALPENQKFVKLSLSYGKKSKQITQTFTLTPSQLKNIPTFAVRQNYVWLLQKLSKQKKTGLANCCKQIDNLYEILNEIQYKETNLTEEQEKFFSALLKEIKNQDSQNQGQVSKAFLREDWFDRWGKHYIPSLYRAHLMQVCTNFKDPALQLYGGAMFRENQSNMDTIFIKMPPPQPSAKKVNQIVYKPAPADMSDYYNYGGGCIQEDCLVQLENGKHKRIQDLKKGDRVKGGVIECMVKTPVFGWVEMVKIGNLIITPYHPIIMQGNWIFPSDVQKSEKVKIFVEHFYNFVLENSATATEKCLTIQGIQCIGLGHSITNNPITSHQYFDNKIVGDLHRCKGWSNGDITLRGFLRDETSRTVTGIIDF